MFKKLLTEPRAHHPDCFVYLVHSILDWNGNGISPKEMKDKINKIRDVDQFYCASMIAHLDEESAKVKIGWHGGEVYQMGTFGDIGVIVDPAQDDLIQIAWNCDLGSPHDKKELEKYVQEHKGKIRYPLQLLTQTKGDDSIKYNELILRGDNGTNVKGVFFRSMNSQAKRKVKQLGEIVSELMQINAPVIELPAVPITNYDDIKDPKERKLNFLKAQFQLMQCSSEFYRPELFRSRIHHKYIYNDLF